MNDHETEAMKAAIAETLSRMDDPSISVVALIEHGWIAGRAYKPPQTFCAATDDDTTDAVAEAIRVTREVNEQIKSGYTVLFKRIDKLEAKLKTMCALLAPYEGQPCTTTSADCDHESCERLAVLQALFKQ